MISMLDRSVEQLSGPRTWMSKTHTGVQGWVFDALSSPLTVRETTEVLKEVADSSD
jgi:hypothetical protein